MARRGVLEATSRPVTVGRLVREAAGYAYSYRDIVACPTVVNCVVARSLEDHELITSMTIEDGVLTGDLPYRSGARTRPELRPGRDALAAGCP